MPYYWNEQLTRKMRAITLLILCVTAASAETSISQRIVGGSATTISQYPSIAALLHTENWSYYLQTCAGVILNQRSILTAAQCFEADAATGRWLVRLGSTFASSGGSLFNVNSIVTHEGYNRFIKINDIAVLQVAGFIEYTTEIQATSIAGQLYVLPDEEIVQAVGWGQTSYLGNKSEQLRHVDVAIFNQNSCRRRYLLTAKFVTSNNMCVGWSGGGRGQCIGDAGGPLYHNNVLIGLYSFSNYCGLGTFPSVNTRVNQYLDFILANA